MDDSQWEAVGEYQDRAQKMSGDIRKYTLVKMAALAVLVVTLPTAVIMVQRQTGQTKTVAAGDKAQVYFVPNYLRIPPDRVVKLVLDSGGVKISRVKAVLKFDNTVVNLDSEAMTTSKLKMVREKTSQDTANISGRITIDLDLIEIDKKSPVQGVVEVATFAFKPVTGLVGVETSLDVDTQTLEVYDMSGNIIASKALPAEMVLNLTENEDVVLGAKTAPSDRIEYVFDRTPADMDGDGCVSWPDLKIMGELLGKRVVNGLAGDINGNGRVGVEDISMWVGSYGWGCK